MESDLCLFSDEEVSQPREFQTDLLRPFLQDRATIESGPQETRLEKF